MTIDLEEISCPTISTPQPVKPILRWPGGKRDLVNNHSVHLLPKSSFKRFHDMTIGGGAVPFTWAYGVEKMYLNDALPEVHNLYLTVRDDVDALIEQANIFADQIKIALQADGNDSARVAFVAMRDNLTAWRLGQSTASKVDAAAWMLVLNRTAVNGLHRVSKKGRCNMPFRTDLVDKPNVDLVRASQLRELNALLVRTDAEITCGDFADRTKHIQKGDYVFFDPPYDPNPKKQLEGKPVQSFTSYTADGFSELDHARLSDELDHINKIGAFFTLTARATPDTRTRYSRWHVHETFMRHNISPKSKGREEVRELIVSNFESMTDVT